MVKGQKRGRRRWIVLGAVVVLLAGTTGAWLLTRSGESAAASASTATVSSETVRETTAASGTIEPANTADLDFAVSGTVTAVLVEAGDRVKKGAALARVSDTALVANRRAALATVEAAVLQLGEDQDADASDTQLAADQTSVAAARSSLTEARQAVSDATLRATIRGTVTSVGLETGDVVGSSQGSTGAATDTSTAASTSAFSIVSTGRFVLDATVAAADVDQLKTGLQAELTVSGITDTVYGTVSSVGRVAETNSSGAAVFPVTIAVTGTQDGLYAGTTADATVIVSQEPDVLTVSTPALQSDGDATYVEKVVDGTSERTDIEIGDTYGMTTEVLSGLEEGDVVEVPGFTRGSGADDSGNSGNQLPGGDFQGGPPAGFDPGTGMAP